MMGARKSDRALVAAVFLFPLLPSVSGCAGCDGSSSADAHTGEAQ